MDGAPAFSSSPLEDPFSGTDISSDMIQLPEDLDNDEEKKQDSDIESAVEADECLTFEPGLFIFETTSKKRANSSVSEFSDVDSETLTSQIDEEIVQEPSPPSLFVSMQG